ncbi:MAG TPA: ABC transporter permease [Nostocaceae cyanobacterium]|nr:ABC transporter permease [Nostocaceae cyanobacterium]
MQKYLKVLRFFWSAAIASEMEYRINFILSALSSIGNLAGSIFGLSLFYRTGYNFAGWSWDSALIVLGVFTLLQGFTETFLAPNLNRIVRHVQEGTLDFILLKPIQSQFWLSTHTLSLWGINDLIFGIAIIIYAGSRLGLNLGNYLLGLLPLMCSIVILYSLWFMLGSTTIWFVKIYNITEVLRGLLEAGRYPIVAYPAVYRFFFTFIVPVAFLTTIPSQIILGQTQPTWLLSTIFLAVFLFVISTQFWRFALRFYTSASS